MAVPVFEPTGNYAPVWGCLALIRGVAFVALFAMLRRSGQPVPA